MHTLRRVPNVFRGAYHRIQAQALARVVSTTDGGHTGTGVESAGVVAARTLFLMLPRLLLYLVGRGGVGGARELRRWVTMFDQGEWGHMLAASRATAVGGRRQRAPRSADQRENDRVSAVQALVEQGELSHAARLLRSSGLAPGTDTTLDEL